MQIILGIRSKDNEESTRCKYPILISLCRADKKGQLAQIGWDVCRRALQTRTSTCNKKIAVENKLMIPGFLLTKSTFAPYWRIMDRWRRSKAQEYSKDDLVMLILIFDNEFSMGCCVLFRPYSSLLAEGKTKLPSADGANMFAVETLDRRYVDRCRRRTERCSSGYGGVSTSFDWCHPGRKCMSSSRFHGRSGTSVEGCHAWRKELSGSNDGFILRNRLTCWFAGFFEYEGFAASSQLWRCRTPTFHPKSITDPNRKSRS